MPEISVAIATYNGEKYIEKQLQSVMDQSLRPDEVIIFDDYSKDNTADIIAQFIKDNHLNWKLNVNPVNVGFIENFYQAICMVSGKYIFLCDQDDIWHADKIEKIMSMFYAHNEIHAINTGFSTVDHNGSPISYKPEGIGFKLLNGRIKKGTLVRVDAAHIIRNNISPGCTMAFDQRCRSMYIHNASRRWPHDWELNIFAAMMDGLYFYGDELIDYRIHKDNAIGLKGEITYSGQDREHLRLEFAKKEYDRVSLYFNSLSACSMSGKAKKQLETYHRFTHNRYEALRKKRFHEWVRGFVYMPLYIQAVGLKGMLGDGLYIMKRTKK